MEALQQLALVQGVQLLRSALGMRCSGGWFCSSHMLSIQYRTQLRSPCRLWFMSHGQSPVSHPPDHCMLCLLLLPSSC